jgi:hypothetical protein
MMIMIQKRATLLMKNTYVYLRETDGSFTLKYNYVLRSYDSIHGEYGFGLVYSQWGENDQTSEAVIDIAGQGPLRKIKWPTFGGFKLKQFKKPIVDVSRFDYTAYETRVAVIYKAHVNRGDTLYRFTGVAVCKMQSEWMVNVKFVRALDYVTAIAIDKKQTDTNFNTYAQDVQMKSETRIIHQWDRHGNFYIMDAIASHPGYLALRKFVKHLDYKATIRIMPGLMTYFNANAIRMTEYNIILVRIGSAFNPPYKLFMLRDDRCKKRKTGEFIFTTSQLISKRNFNPDQQHDFFFSNNESRLVVWPKLTKSSNKADIFILSRY